VSDTQLIRVLCSDISNIHWQIPDLKASRQCLRMIAYGSDLASQQTKGKMTTWILCGKLSIHFEASVRVDRMKSLEKLAVISFMYIDDVHDMTYMNIIIPYGTGRLTTNGRLVSERKCRRHVSNYLGIPTHPSTFQVHTNSSFHRL
jgi:hypothetical protein